MNWSEIKKILKYTKTYEHVVVYKSDIPHFVKTYDLLFVKRYPKDFPRTYPVENCDGNLKLIDTDEHIMTNPDSFRINDPFINSLDIMKFRKLQYSVKEGVWRANLIYLIAIALINLFTDSYYILILYTAYLLIFFLFLMLYLYLIFLKIRRKKLSYNPSGVI